MVPISDTDGSAVDQFDLANLDPARRKSAWTELLRSYYYSFDVDYPDDFTIGQFKSFDVAGIRVGTMTTDGMLVSRRPSHVSAEAQDYYLLPIPMGGSLTLTQCGRETSVDCSELAFLGTAEAYSYEQRGANSVHAVRIPGNALRQRARNVDDWTSVTFQTDSNPMTPIVLSYARTFCENGAALTTTMGDRAADHLLDLVALMLDGADENTDETAIRIAHRRRALHVIESRYQDSQLTLGSIASELHMSERYLQKIFADRNETLSGIIRNRRISEARKLLTNRDSSRASVSSIAYKVGFSDPAYFSRVFRHETGIAPVDFGTRSDTA